MSFDKKALKFCPCCEGGSITVVTSDCPEFEQMRCPECGYELYSTAHIIEASHYEESNGNKGVDFEYKRIWGVKSFKGTHPDIMKNWVTENRNELDIMSLPTAYHMGDFNLMVSDFIESLTGYRIGEYKNFRLIK